MELHTTKVARDVCHIMSHIHTWQFRLLGQMKQPVGLHLGGLRRLRSFARHCIVCGELPQWRHAARTCRWLRIGHFSPHANSKDVTWIDLDREGIDSDGAQNRSDIQKRCWFTEPPRSQGDKAGTLVDYVTGQMERVYPGDLQRVFAPGGRRVGHAWTMLVFVTQKQYCIQCKFKHFQDMFRYVCFVCFYVTWVAYILSHHVPRKESSSRVSFRLATQVISKCWRRQHGTRRRTWQRNCGPSGPQLCLGESTGIPQYCGNTSINLGNNTRNNLRKYMKILFVSKIDWCLFQMLIDKMRKLWWQPTVQPSFYVFVVRFTVHAHSFISVSLFQSFWRWAWPHVKGLEQEINIAFFVTWRGFD